MAFATNPYYSVITIDHTLVGGALTDFVLYLDDLPADAYAEIHSTGKDIRFSDSTGTTELAFDLRELDTGAGTCEIMVKIPSVSAVTDTDIRIYYGDHTLTAYDPVDTYGRNAVYSLFEAVFGLSEDLAGATGASIYIDRTGNGYTGTDYTDATGKTGKVGEGQEFDGSNDYISASFPSVVDGTILQWIRTDNVTNDRYIFYAGDSSTTNRYVGIQMAYVSSQRRLRWLASPKGSLLVAGELATPIAISTWYHVAVEVTSGVGNSLFLNGVEQTLSYSVGSSSVDDFFNDVTTPDLMSFGCRFLSGSRFNFFNGFLDEIMISKAPLGDPYISTLYESQNAAFGTFYSVGTKQGGAPTFTPLLMWF